MGYLAFAGIDIELPLAEACFRALTASDHADATERFTTVLYSLRSPDIARTHAEREVDATSRARQRPVQCRDRPAPLLRRPCGGARRARTTARHVGRVLTGQPQ